MFENKKIFITGGTGSIGNAICQYFNKNKCSEIYASTTNLDKVNKDNNFINFKQLNKCINNCGHIFCKSCLDTWLNRGNNNCPLCRQKIEYFEYRTEKYRLINISRQTDRSINPVTIYRTHPKIIILLYKKLNSLNLCNIQYRLQIYE